MMIKRIQCQNLLSFGPNSPNLELGPINVLIGPNGVGKSNFIEAISLLKSAPRALADPVRKGGGIRDWLWKGSADIPVAKVSTVIENPGGSMPLRYEFAFTESVQRFELVDERIENAEPYAGHERPYFYYRYEHNHPVFNLKGETRQLRREDVDPEQSILSQRKDPEQYPELTYLGEVLGKIRIYRDWTFGRKAAPRLPQEADQRNDFLDEEDFLNLGLVLNHLRKAPVAKRSILENLKLLFEGIDDFDVIIEGGTVQVFLQEGDLIVPATRLSDGTIRFLCLLAILCHPAPPPLICLEEPELGLHPDILPSIARLLLEASERTQLIVTTHSDVLVDAFNDTPEAVIVCEKDEGSTTMRRLDKKDLSVWLKKYPLGELWRRGELGGNRW